MLGHGEHGLPAEAVEVARRHGHGREHLTCNIIIDQQWHVTVMLPACMLVVRVTVIVSCCPALGWTRVAALSSPTSSTFTQSLAISPYAATLHPWLG